MDALNKKQLILEWSFISKYGKIDKYRWQIKAGITLQIWEIYTIFFKISMNQQFYPKHSIKNVQFEQSYFFPRTISIFYDSISSKQSRYFHTKLHNKTFLFYFFFYSFSIKIILKDFVVFLDKSFPDDSLFCHVCNLFCVLI